jgi:hypothetical protein
MYEWAIQIDLRKYCDAKCHSLLNFVSKTNKQTNTLLSIKTPRSEKRGDPIPEYLWFIDVILLTKLTVYFYLLNWRFLYVRDIKEIVKIVTKHQNDLNFGRNSNNKFPVFFFLFGIFVINLCYIIREISLFHIIREISLFPPAYYPAPATIWIPIKFKD